MHAPLSQAALLLLATAWLSLQSTAQLSVTVHVPLYKAAPILLAACHSSLTAAQLSVVRGEDGDADDEDDNGVEDDADDDEDDDEDKDKDDEEVDVPNMSAWLAHGILAFFAWGVLVPLAVNSSLFRDLLPKGPLWFNLHRAFNTAAFALFVALFSIAVSYTMKEGMGHFSNDHQMLGLAMFILTTFQVMGGVFRPHLPETGLVGKKTNVRKGWEGGHRLFGAALLACGFWQMSDGIKLFSKKYSVSESNEAKVWIAYWVWIGVVSATIVLGIWHSKVRKGIPNDPSKASRAVDVTNSSGLDTDSGIVIPRDPHFNDES
jgi:hypothetical protein